MDDEVEDLFSNTFFQVLRKDKALFSKVLNHNLLVVVPPSKYFPKPKEQVP
jgi:hypothetical protein